MVSAWKLDKVYVEMSRRQGRKRAQSPILPRRCETDTDGRAL